MVVTAVWFLRQHHKEDDYYSLAVMGSSPTYKSSYPGRRREKNRQAVGIKIQTMNRSEDDEDSLEMEEEIVCNRQKDLAGMNYEINTKTDRIHVLAAHL